MSYWLQLKIMLLTSKTSVDFVAKRDSNLISYFPVKEQDKWKADLLCELIDIRDGSLNLPEFETEVSNMKDYICTY